MTPSEFVTDVLPVARVVAGRVTASFRARGFGVEFSDAYSGAMLGAWKASESFRAGKGTKPTTWAFPYCQRYAVMSANEAAGLTASRGDGLGHVLSLDDVLRPAEGEDASPEEPADPYAIDGDRAALGVAVRQAVADLPAEDRAVVFATYWQGMGPTEIGEVVGLSKSGVRYALNRAHATLRDALED